MKDSSKNFSSSQLLLFNLVLSFFCGLLTEISYAQTASFSAPDTVCVGQNVSIINTSTNITSNYWNFCSGDLGLTPDGVNLGNISGQIVIPTYSQVMVEGEDHFLFMMSANDIPSGNAKLIRYFYGNSFTNPVQSYTLMPNIMLHYNAECFRVYHEADGNYYGFLTNGLSNNILRYNFGSSLWNTPTVTNLGNLGGMDFPHGMEIVKDNGNWIGIVSNAFGNTISMITWGTSLANIPTGINLGNIGGLNGPRALAIQKDEMGNWYVFVNNYYTNSLSRIYFGNSFLNPPVGTNLGALPGVNGPEGLTMLKDCDKYYGFIANYAIGSNSIVRISFPSGLGGPVTSTNLGNIGNLDRPGHFSNIFRDEDAIYMFLGNRPGHVTRLKFNNCGTSTTPSSNLFNPPLYSYSTPGTYSVVLVMDEGLFSQDIVCKDIVVLDQQVFDLGPDITICYGESIPLQPIIGTVTNGIWSNGSTQASIIVNTEGYYWLETNSNTPCSFRDSIFVNVDTIVKPNLGDDLSLCIGDTAYLFVTELYDDIQWSTGALTNSIMVTQSGNFWVNIASVFGCSAGDTIQITVNPSYYQINQTHICLGDSSLVFGTWQTQAGVYYDSLVSMSGCDSILATNLCIEDNPVVALGDYIEICEGDSVLLGVDNPNFTYLWNTGSTFPVQWAGSSGTYCLTVTNSYGCKSYDSIAVIEGNSYFTEIDTMICFGESVYFYGNFWNTAGVYSVNLQTVAGCDSIFKLNLHVNELSLVDLGEDYFICEGEPILIMLRDSGVTYQWQDGSHGNHMIITNPGIYWVTAIVGHCIGSDTIVFNPCSEIWFPNAFTPNGDLLNDLFQPSGQFIEDYHLSIYNRWGELLFYTNTFEEGWDGSFKGNPCPADVYTFLCRFKGVGPIYGSREQKTGKIHLMR